jgi:hypothetical protein
MTGGGSTGRLPATRRRWSTAGEHGGEAHPKAVVAWREVVGSCSATAKAARRWPCLWRRRSGRLWLGRGAPRERGGRGGDGGVRGRSRGGLERWNGGGRGARQAAHGERALGARRGVE